MRAASHASLFAVVIIITSALGFFREVVVARTFGASMEMDCFIAAFAIVSFIGAILSPQTMQTMFMPAYQDEMEERPQTAHEMINNISIILLTILGIGTLAGYALAPYIVKSLMPGFNDEQIHLTKDLIRTMIPLVTIYGLASLGHAVCNSHKQFILPLSSQTMNNITLLALLFVLPIHSVQTLAWYHLFGGIVSGVILFFAYLRLVPNHHANFKNRTYINAFFATWPLIILAFFDQAAILLPRSFGSLLEHGDITALNYAFRLITLPVAIIAMAIASVLFPTIITHVRAQQGSNSGAIRMGTSMLIFCLAPISVLLCIENEAIVKLLFSSGNFDADAVSKTASSLKYYALGIVGFGYLLFLNRIYCAYRRYWHYVYANIIAFLALVIMAYVLSTEMGRDGIAIAFSSYCYIACLLLIYGIRKMAGLNLISLQSITHVLLSLVASSLVLQLGHADNIWSISIESVLFIACYSALLMIMGDKELRTILIHLKIL